MFNRFFNSENGLWLTVAQLTDCIFLSLFWLLCCFPVFTLGASFAALYDASFRAFWQGNKNSWQRFFRVFRDNWKAGILPTAVFLGAGSLLTGGIISCWNAAVYGQISWTLFSAIAFVGVIAVGILSVMFPMLSRFENSFGGLLKNTVLLALANLPRTTILGLVNTMVVLICVRYVVPIFFLPALGALLSSLLLEPMFRPYLSEEENPEDAA